MVVLAASVCTRSGKPLLSRQFRPIPRSRIDGLLAAFPKLIPVNSQHTTVETADVRFVYHPFEELYVLLITNKGSNILQDISTLSLIVRLISSLTPTMTEAAILHHSFDLLCAFDEVVSLGYKENVSLNQVRSILEGDSHEEKIQEIIARNKEAEAKEELKRRAKQLEMQRREQQKVRSAGGAGAGGGSGGYGGGGYASVPSQPRYEAPAADRDPYRSASPAPSSLKPAFKGTGMKLGKKGKQSDLIDALGGEVNVTAEEEYTAPVAAAPVAEQVSEDVLDKVEQDSVHVTVREQLSLTLLRDGGLESFEVKGDLNLKITDPSLAKVKLTLAAPSSGSKVQDIGNDLAFKQHPNVAKFANVKGVERVVALKDTSRSFPVNNSIGVLRWRLDTKDESVVPLSINAWPQPRGDGQCDVVVEYELEAQHLSLRNVVISIPLPDNALPSVSNHNGEWRIDQRTNAFTWQIDLIDAENATGSLEFVCKANGPDDFFPMQVGFVAAGSVAEVEVEGVALVDGGEAVAFSQEKILTVERFEIV